MVHLCGITFYGIFASGELQSWAEPTIEEQRAWNPMEAGVEKETAIDDPQTTQINKTKTANYGAVQSSHVAGNPFAYPNIVSEEAVQPVARDYVQGDYEASNPPDAGGGSYGNYAETSY